MGLPQSEYESVMPGGCVRRLPLPGRSVVQPLEINLRGPQIIAKAPFQAMIGYDLRKYPARD
jgi:hypothetical protein